MNNELESTENKADQMEERIQNLEDRNMEMVQVIVFFSSKSFFKLKKPYNIYQTDLTGKPEGEREKGAECI